MVIAILVVEFLNLPTAYVCLAPERGVSISGYFWHHKDCAYTRASAV